MRRTLVGIALVAVVAAGVLLYMRTRARPEPQAAAAAPAPPTGIIAAGTIRAKFVVPVPAPVDGVIEALPVEPGQPVYEGQVIGRIRNAGIDADRENLTREAAQAEERLVRLEGEFAEMRLEASRARAELSRVQTDFAAAEKYYQRERLLYEKGATPRLVFEKAEKEYRDKRAERDTAEQVANAAAERLDALGTRVDAARELRDEKNRALDEVKERAAAAEVRSPVDGVLVAIARKAGEEVTTDVADLFRIAVNVAELEAVVEPEPPALARVRAGQEALLSVAGVPDAIVGRVKEVAGNQVVVEFASPTPAVQPGMTAQVRIAFSSTAP